MFAAAVGKPIERYIDWITRSALPLWAERGFDSERARFRERLDEVGNPITVPHRAMVQARQIYVFAHAAMLGWFPDGARLAEVAMTSLLRDYCDETASQASFLFSVDDRGHAVSNQRDAYAHAFLLFALAWLHALNGDQAHLRMADKIIAYIDAEFTDPLHDGLFDALPLIDRSKRQNPLMHLLEAYLFLEQAAPGRGYIERASRLVVLFKRRLLVAEPGVILEHFSENWDPHPDPIKAGLFEPGHHFEWAWLLDRYSRMSNVDETPLIERLYRVAVTAGIAADGLIYDEVGIDMRPRRRSHRVWPHTEAIKAAVVRHETGDATAMAMAMVDNMADRLQTRFLDRPFAGGWVDQLSETGQPLVDYVPASSLYHLFLAAAEAARCLRPARLSEATAG